MVRIALALLLFCFVSLHAGLNLSVAGVEPVAIAALDMSDELAADGEGAATPEQETNSSCHDVCEWFHTWRGTGFPEQPRSWLEQRESAMFSGQIALVLPPPR